MMLLLWGFFFEGSCFALLLWLLGFWAFGFLMWEAFGREKNH
jgi:hypothetical protein